MHRMGTQAKPKAKPAPPQKGPGRPRLGTFRLECMLPAKVLAELMRQEAETGLYRTRVAANVLVQWAKNGGAHSP